VSDRLIGHVSGTLTARMRWVDRLAARLRQPDPQGFYCGDQAVAQSCAAGHTGAVIAVLRVGLVAALVAGVLAAGSGSPSPRCPPGASCASPPLPKVTFTPTINGKTGVPRTDGHVPSYRVRPGEQLVMSVAVTVPKHLRFTALWLGISTGTWGNGPNGPVGMNPVLVHSGQPLSTGVHTFGLNWRIPQGRSGGSLYLIFAWSSHQPDADVAGPIAVLALAQHADRQLIWGGGLAPR
jgi:hypothetical protein